MCPLWLLQPVCSVLVLIFKIEGEIDQSERKSALVLERALLVLLIIVDILEKNIRIFGHHRCSATHSPVWKPRQRNTKENFFSDYDAMDLMFLLCSGGGLNLRQTRLGSSITAHSNHKAINYAMSHMTFCLCCVRFSQNTMVPTRKEIRDIQLIPYCPLVTCSLGVMAKYSLSRLLTVLTMRNLTVLLDWPGLVSVCGFFYIRVTKKNWEQTAYHWDYSDHAHWSNLHIYSNLGGNETYFLSMLEKIMSITCKKVYIITNNEINYKWVIGKMKALNDKEDCGHNKRESLSDCATFYSSIVLYSPIIPIIPIVQHFL